MVRPRFRAPATRRLAAVRSRLRALALLVGALAGRLRVLLGRRAPRLSATARRHPSRTVAVAVVLTLVASLLATDALREHGREAGDGGGGSRAATDAPGQAARPTVGELPERSTPVSTTRRNENGSYTTTVHSAAVNYRAADGSVRRIDPNLHRISEGGYAWRSGANSFEARFKDTAAAAFNEIRVGGRTLRVTAEGATATKATVDGSKISYPRAYPNADLVYTVTPTGVKEVVELAGPNARTSYTFRMTADDKGPAPTVQRRADGSYAVSLSPRRGPAFVLDAPVVQESADGREAAPPALDAKPALRVRQSGRELVTTLSLDPEWLRAPGRQFPVHLDPTLTIQPTAEDASFTAPANYTGYAGERLYIGGDSGNSWRAAMKFDVAGLPADAQVTDAKLGLYYDGWCVAGPAAFCGGTEHVMDAHRLTSSWTPSTASANLTFDATASGSHTLPASLPQGWMTWPVTSTVTAWVDGLQPNHGLLVKRRTEAVNSSGPVPPGRRFTGSPALQPKLEITYTSDAVDLLEPATLHSNGADLAWTRYTGSSGAPFGRYEVHRNPGSAIFTPSASTLLATIPDIAVTTYRDTTAAPSKTFTYRIVVNSSPSNPRTVALPAAGQASKVLQPGPADGRHTYIYYTTTLTNCLNYGTDTGIRTGTDTTNRFRGLLHFDLRDIPQNATIDSATMSLYVNYSASAALSVQAHRVTRPWKEGTGGSQCNGSGATWYETEAGQPWTTQGGDIDATVAAKVDVPAGQSAQFHDFAVTNLVQTWVRGTPNNGLALRATDETLKAGANLVYVSDDSTASAALRPRLTVAYRDGSAAQGPRVSLAAPGPGSTVSGSSVRLAAAAEDDRRVDEVEFLVDGSVVGRDTAAPYEIAWNSSSVANGARSLTVRATDDAGNVTTSAAVGVTVDNTAPPTGSLTAPASGATVTGSAVTLSANASDDAGVAQVEFLVDGVRVGAPDTTSPYSIAWNTLNPLTPAFNGSHEVKAVVTDSSGQQYVTAPRTVTVDNLGASTHQADFALNDPGSTADDVFPPAMTENTAAGVPVQDPYAGTTRPDGTSGGSLNRALADAPTDDAGTPPANCPAGAYCPTITVTNASGTTWQDSTAQVWYRWYAPNGAVLFEGRSSGTFPSTFRKGNSATFPLTIHPPALPPGIQEGTYRLRVDVWDPATATWFSAKGNAPVDNPVLVARSLATKLGLERYYQYDGEAVGAGMSTLTNVANGDMLARWTPFFSPGRGLSTMVDLTYNSLEDHSRSPAGTNFSLSVSGLTRLGKPLDIHPNKADEISGRSNKYVEFTDGDGTTHRFDGTTGTDGVTRWQEPPGVNLYLRSLPDNDPNGRWALTRPDKVTFYFDADGFPLSVQDRNDNRIRFTLEDTPPGEDPGGPKKRVTRVTDAGGRSFLIDYWSKDEAKKAHVRGNIQTITDHSGSRLDFDYYDDGNLLRLTQRGGTNADGGFLADRSFVFTYTTSNGAGPAIGADGSSGTAARLNPEPKTPNQSARLYSVIDPRQAETRFAYYQASDGAHLRWKLKSRTNRVGQTTGYAYDLTNRVTTVTAPLSRITKYSYDTTGKVTSIVNPKNETTGVQWSTDHKVSRVTEPTGKFSEYTYNDNGFPLTQKNQLGQVTELTYYDDPVDTHDTGRHLSLVKTVTTPKGVASAEAGDYQTTFGYDGAGNPNTITDPSQAVTDYDYHLAGSANPGTVAQVKDANGNAPTVFEAYHASGQPTVIRDPLGKQTRFDYNADGQVRWIQDPNHENDSGADERAYRTFFDYDSFGRLGRQSAPKSTAAERGTLLWSGMEYDPNDNVTRAMDPHYGSVSGGDPKDGPVTVTGYDAMDRPTLVTGPDTSVDPDGERTRLDYDAAGRTSKVTKPKGVASSTVDDHATVYGYDPLDRIIRQTEYGTSTSQVRVTQMCYDLAGDLRSVTSPRAGTATVTCPGNGPVVAAYTSETDYDAAHRPVVQRDELGHATRTTYDGNGNIWAVESDITTGRAARTEIDHDQRDMPVVVRERFDGATGRNVTTRMEYDKNGNRWKTISPRAFDAADGGTPTNYVTVNQYDALNRLVRTDLPFDGRDGTERQYVHNSYDPNGNLAWTSLPVTTSAASSVNNTARTVMTYFDPGWIRTSDDPGNPKVHFDYAAQGWQTKRQVELRSSPGTLDENDRMFWDHFVDGQLRSRTDREGQSNRYEYDAHNNLTKAFDNGLSDPGEKEVETQSTFTGYDEPDKVRHRKQGATVWTFSDYDYDGNGNVTVRKENGEESDAGVQSKAPRTFQLTYDGADWLTQQLDLGVDSACKDDTRTVNAWWSTGWEKQRDIYRAAATCTADSTTWPKKQTTTWTHFDNGKLRNLVTKNGAGTTTESHDVGYFDAAGDYVNGNRTSDRYVLVRAAGNTATTCLAASPCDAKYTYDARDRLLTHQLRTGRTDTYTFDEPTKLIGDTSIRAGNVTTEVKNGTTTSKRYTGDQLTDITVGGVTGKYWYDDWGNLDCLTLAAGSKANCSPSDGSAASSNLITDYGYDYLNRLTNLRQYGSGTRTDRTTYTYDALDRTTKEVEDHTGTGTDRTTAFTYQGLTSLATEERQTGGTDPRTKTFSYDSYGHRIAMTDKATGSTTEPNKYTYSVDVHSSMSQLIDDAGSVRASYGYNAYGGADSPSSDPQSLTTGDTGANPINPYRYSGKRVDTGTTSTGTTPSPVPNGSGGYDMGARRYGPDTASFLQQDMYQGALANLGLALDPLTQNRYALAGGNPISYIETDGHMVTADGGGGGSTTPSPSPAPAPTPPSDGGGGEPSLLDRGLDRLGDAAEWGADRVEDAANLGRETWDRGSTLAVYAWDTTTRRITNPAQTLKDVGTGTVLEGPAAIEAIVVEDAELKRDGPYCGKEAECLTGASVPDGADAITIGHSIRFSGDKPDDPLVGHEMQHVYDIENVGGLPFYASYAGSYMSERFDMVGVGPVPIAVPVKSHDDAYRSVYWERRAYHVGNNYGQGERPRGWPW